MPPRKRGGAGGAEAGSAKSQCLPQIFAGLLMFAHGSVGGSEVILEARVNERGGKLLKHKQAKAYPFTPSEPATHAVISNTFPLDDELVAALRTQACNQAAIIVRQQYISDCVMAGKLLPVPSYAARLDAPPAPAAVPLPRRIEPESDDEDTAAALVDDFVPPPPTGDRCSACQTELLWCEIATCQACLKTFTNRGDNARLRALHLRFRVNHPNKAIVAALFELSEYEGLYGETPSSVSFAKAASMLKATPRSISCVGDLDLFDPPFVGSKTRLYLPELLAKGTCERLENFRDVPERVAACRLARLPYVGAKLAKSWAERGWLTPQAVLANLPHDEAAKLSSWQKLVLQHADDLLLPIHEADRAPLVAAVEAAARVAEGESGCRGSLKWQFVGGTARGKTGSHDLDFLFTHDEEGEEVGMLGKMLQALARSEALDLDPATGKPRLAVVLSSGAGGDAQDGRAADSCGLEGVRAWDPVTPFDSDVDANKALLLIKLKGQPLRHIDLLMVPRSEWAFWVLGWVGSTQLRRMLSQHAKDVLRTADLPKGKPLRLNHKELKDDLEPRDAKYLGSRVTKLGVKAALVPHELIQRDYVGKRMYPDTEAEVWSMLELPWRPFTDRNA